MAENIEKYIQSFVDTFGVKQEEAPSLKYKSIASWDSIGHMNLISALEENFDIEFETEDVIDFSSYEKGLEILKKYGVKF